MEHDQEMYAQHDALQDNLYQSSVYSSSDILSSFQTPSSFLVSHHSRQRFPPSDISFRSHNHHNHHDQHEAAHVYNSPQLTLDPSTLDLRPSPSDDISISSSPTSSSVNNPVTRTGSSAATTPTASLRISTYNSTTSNNNNNSSSSLLSPSSSTPTTTGTAPPGTPPITAGPGAATTTAAGVLTGRKTRAALEQLQIPTQLSVDSPQQQQHLPHRFHPSHDFQNSDMHDVQMQQSELQMHVDDHNQQPLIDPIHHHQPNTLTPHSHVYSVLSDTPTTTTTTTTTTSSSSRYYLPSDSFANSPTTVSSSADLSPHSDLQPISPTSTLASSPTSTVPLARSYRSGSLSASLTTNHRSLSLITSLPITGSIGQPISPSHLHGPPLSSHPHMHPSPYYMNHGPSSPIYPSTPPTSHHAQTSSSSSRSSGQTHYSLRGSPAPHAFGRGHGRSNSYGTGSTMSVRSTSPASSVTSAFTSLSGGGGGGNGGGSTPSTSGPLGSPISYGDNSNNNGNGDMQMSFTSTQEPLTPHPHPPPAPHFPRAQSHPPSIIPSYPSHHSHHSHHHHHPQHRKSYLSREPYPVSRNATGYMDGGSSSGQLPPPLPPQLPPRDAMGWSNMEADVYIPTGGTRLTDEEFQAQYPPKPLMTRAPHRKQKLANSDRKAICMYAKQHPSARQEDIAARYNVERSTISKILKNKERWLGCPDDDAKVARKRKPRFDDLELVLKLWVEEARPQKIVLSDALIRSKAKEEARRLGILEDKFKASSGWLENFKHRVGIRKGKYIGRDHWQEGSESDFDDPNSQRFQEQQQRANWSTNNTKSLNSNNNNSSGNAKDSWDLSLMGSTSPLKETDSIQQQLVAESSGKQQSQQLGFPSEELNTAQSSPQIIDARPGSRHENNSIESVTRKTRSRTLAETREPTTATSASASSSSSSSSAPTPISALPNSLNPSPSSLCSLSSSSSSPLPLPPSAVESSSRAVAVTVTGSSSVPAIQMDATLLLRPHDTSHSIIADEDSGSSRKSSSPIGRRQSSVESRTGASETLSLGGGDAAATLSSIGSQGQGFVMTNQRGDGCLIQGQ